MNHGQSLQNTNLWEEIRKCFMGKRAFDPDAERVVVLDARPWREHVFTHSNLSRGTGRMGSTGIQVGNSVSKND